MALISDKEISQYAEVNTLLEEDQFLAVMLLTDRHKKMIRLADQTAEEYIKLRDSNIDRRTEVVPWRNLVVAFKSEVAYNRCWL